MLTLTTPLGVGVFRLVSFDGHEALSQLFSFDLELRADNDASVPFEALLGEPVTIGLALPGGGRRSLSGIVSRFSQGKRGRSETAYSMEVVPQLWLLTRTTDSRIFQQQSVPEILEAVLPATGPSFELTRSYPKHDYVVQYRESDFDFASRLMEEEGIFYFFRHTADGHEMVIGDAPQAHPDIPGASTIRYKPSEPGASSAARVFSWEKNQEIRSGRVTLRDYDFELPGQSLQVTAATQGSVAAGEVTHQLALPANSSLEIYDYPGGYAKHFDGINPSGGAQPAELAKVLPAGQRKAGDRMQEEAQSSLVIQGASTARNLAAGYLFTLDRHFDADGDYLLTSVSHRGNTSDGGSYSNAFTCIPAGLPYRPPRTTPRPVIGGPQSAVVVGPAGEEIFTDRYGRVKVQFHWDREGSGDQNSSCWVRVAALHAGLENGFNAIPRVGHEVLVAFEEGDPDRPIIVGSVYNTHHPPPPPPPPGGKR